MGSVSKKQYPLQVLDKVATQGRPEILEADFLNIRVHAMDFPAFREMVGEVIDTGDKCLVANHNLHSLHLWHKEAKASEISSFHRYYERARWTLIDGMSMVMLAKAHGYPVGRDHRISYNQTLPRLLEAAEENHWRVFYLGSSEFVAKKGGDMLRKQYPGLTLATHHGFFSKEKDSPANQAVLAQIAAFRPHILFVGMGMPTQEKWVEENFDAIRANVIVPSGATLDYFAGALPMPPSWIANSGFEWAYRLAHEPQRLAFRYLAEPWLILGNILRLRAQQIGRRRLFGWLNHHPRVH
jgi:N-acetylglucosaminyldiphosphoundecaprenol N-acetyl-beta-D-mannosaminyltransferase